MSSRPPVFTWNEELHFGPPSEPIDIQAFVSDAQNLHSQGRCPWFESRPTENVETDACKIITGWNEWQELPKDVTASIEEDCDLTDLTSSLFKTLSSQKRMHYIQNVHLDAISQCGIAPSRKKNKGKSKQHVENDDLDLEELRGQVDHTPLKIWKLKAAAKPYVRSGHVSDQNALDMLRPKTPDPLNEEPPCFHEVLITFTSYTRNTWYPYTFSRVSQHALLSGNNLADFWSCIPCALKGNASFPREVVEVNADLDSFGRHVGPSKEIIVGYEPGDSETDLDQVVMVIEGVAYHNDHGAFDYADKLLSHLERFKPPSAAPPPLPLGPYERPKSAARLRKGLPLDAVQLRKLALRINEPYWVLHRGSCEHWFVVDEIRLQSPRDPTSGYPIGLQRTPALRPLCRICCKVPATMSVLNDIRLGESPSLACQLCWELFGGPPQAKGDGFTDPVVVVPIALER